MALTEESRYQLFQRLEELLGVEEASTLMELLPPVGWADVATKRDLANVEQRLGSRIDGLGSRTDGLRSHVDGVEQRLGERIDHLGQRLDERIDHLEQRLGSRIDGLGVELRAEMYREQRNHTVAIIGANATITAVLLTAFQLI